MPEALRELQALGYSLGIITSNTEVNVQIFLRSHGLEFFDFVRCSSKLLGKARMIRSVIRRQHVRAADILFVGDETRDIEAAKKVGIRMAAVTWGYNSRRSLEAMKPDFVFENPGELVAFLANGFPTASPPALSTPTPATSVLDHSSAYWINPSRLTNAAPGFRRTQAVYAGNPGATQVPLVV